MARRGCKGGRAVQLKKLKRELHRNGVFDPSKAFPTEKPIIIPDTPNQRISPPSKASSSSS